MKGVYNTETTNDEGEVFTHQKAMNIPLVRKRGLKQPNYSVNVMRCSLTSNK